MAGDITNLTLQTLTFDDLKFDLTEEDFRNLQLRYRGEGNDNLVLHAPNVRYVLRFCKHKVFVEEVHEDEKLKTSFMYYFAFIRPLFSVYCVLPVLAKAPESEVQKFDDALFCLRPSHRREKRVFYSGVEIHPDYAFTALYAEYLKFEKHFGLRKAPSSNRLCHLLSSNYLNYRDFVFTLLTDVSFSSRITATLGSCTNIWSVEIKPKQAWSAVVDRHVMCVYCMNQFFKLSENKIRSRNKYCPLDLFSGNRRRMQSALTALLQEPQNNLRIFRNGELVYGDDCSMEVDDILREWFNYDSERYVDLFCHLVTEALLSELANDSETLHLSCKPYQASQKRYRCPSLNLELLEQNLARKSQCLRDILLPENSVLGRIFRLQQLDECGMEVVYDYYETHKSEFESEFSYVDRLIANSFMVDDHVRMPELNVVEAYLLSAAAKDLSILMAFERTSQVDRDSRSFTVTDFRNQSYKVNISVVDVGPKPISCIKKHWKRDANVLTACARELCPESELRE